MSNGLIMRPIFVYKLLVSFLGVSGHWIFPDELHMHPSTTINKNCGDTPYSVRARPKLGRMFENPWLVLLRHPEETLHFCHGTLISHRYVLTTALCGQTVVTNAKARKQQQATEIVLGEFNLSVEPDCVNARNCSLSVTIRSIDKVIAHHNFSISSYQNDIALLYLNDSVQYDNTIRPICLPLIAIVDDTDYYRQTIYNTIWTRDNIPRQIWMRNIPTVQCKEQVKNLLMLNDGQICARIVDNETIDMVGSAGSALQVDHHDRIYQFGLLSVGYSNAVEKAPYIYLDLSKYVNWIHDVLQKTL